ncbi:MAG: M1 family aminopeptidase [Chitinophagales bacterium]
MFHRAFFLLATVNTLLLFLLSTHAFAQTNPYRASGNTLYWKNKMPHPGYWQQDVHYKIQAAIDESTDIITGKQSLTYYNNSPDTLHELFFHLYQNAFQPGSYLHDLQMANGVKPSYGKYEAARQGTTIEKIQIYNHASAQSQTPEIEIDNTILKVKLLQPLLPNDSSVIHLQFRTFYDNGSTRRRMKKYNAWNFKHFNGCQWYPKVCVYDAHSGWNTDQHLNREFYGNFGTFEVELTFASNYIVEATGVLLNEAEVLPDTLKQQLHIRNFAQKKWNEKPGIPIPYKRGITKTWKYRAINVHDFAFTADPTYRIADTTITLNNGNQVKCVAIAQEPHCSGWQNAHEYCAKIIGTFSRDFGNYEYPKMVVADAADGMEYPMLTLDGGKDPEYRGLLVHEVGHNWFYGMLGNNETYRAMMDEGFTQFITAWGLEHIDQTDTIVYEWNKIKNRYLRHFVEPQNIRDSRVYLGYVMDAARCSDEPLNTHSDHFNGALGQGGGYRHVYMKTATMLYNLQYVLGDSLFLAAMQHYVNTWKIAHPYPEDFRNSIIRFTKQDLNWFFDDWMESTKSIDYKIKSVKKGSISEEYNITFERKGSMQMPIDFRVIAKNGKTYDYHIPNTWFTKSTAATTILLPRWVGWDKLRPTYTATVAIPSGIKNIVIDPTERLADINMLNNRLKGNTEVRFDSRIFPPLSRTKYRVWLRPDVWWNAFDGFKIGLHLHGNYMNIKHRFALTVWANTHLAQGGKPYFPQEEKGKAGWFSYRFDYQTTIDKLWKNASVYFSSRWLDGYEMYRTGLQKNLPKNFSIDINLKAFTRNRIAWRNYLLYRNEWSTIWDNHHGFNASINITANFNYAKQKSGGNVRATLRSATLFNSSNYHYLEIEHTNTTSFWRLDFHNRIYGRIGTGNNLPNESALYFAGANAEEMMENKYVRAQGFFPPQWTGSYGSSTNHFHYGGGLNLRGYSGYLVVEKDNAGNTAFAYRGNSGWAVNTELDFARIVQFKKNKLREWIGLNTYLFADAGMIHYTNSIGKNQFSQLRADAGVGAAFTIKKWSVLQGIQPLTIRFDVPFYVSHAPATEKNVQWRFVVGINRAF